MDVYEKLAHPAALAVFFVTLLFPVGVGLLALRRTRSQADFFVGGRAMGKIVVALSAVSSGRSSWLILGVSGMAYTRGVGAMWAVLGYTVVELVQFLTVGPRLRAQSQVHDSITLLDYFESRYRDRRHVLRLAGALIIAVFITAYVSAQLFAGAKTLSAALGLPLAGCLIASALLILVYMVLGGYVAVAYNDVVRAVLMLIALILLPAVAVSSEGGFSQVRSTLASLDPAAVDPFSLGVGALIGFLGIGLGSPGQPHILVRYMSIDDPRNLRGAAVLGTAWNLALGAGAVAVGLAARVLVPDPAALPNSDPEMAYLALASGEFGTALFGLMVGGIFAAILSTADSQLLVVASTFGRDVYERVLREGRPADERAKLRTSRIVVVGSGVLALILAFSAQDLVFWLVLFAWAGLGASLGPPLILSLYWKGTTRNGVLLGMVTGAAVTVIWRLWLKTPTGIYELVPAFLASAVAVVAGSLVRGGRQSAG